MTALPLYLPILSYVGRSLERSFIESILSVKTQVREELHCRLRRSIVIACCSVTVKRS